MGVFGRAEKRGRPRVDQTELQFHDLETGSTLNFRQLRMFMQMICFKKTGFNNSQMIWLVKPLWIRESPTFGW
jgi:hypothetical protein